MTPGAAWTVIPSVIAFYALLLVLVYLTAEIIGRLSAHLQRWKRRMYMEYDFQSPSRESR